MKTIRTKEGLALELPADFCAQHGISDSSSYEIFPLRDGFFLISGNGALPIIAKPVESTQAKPQQAIPTQPELALLRKLSQIKFQERSPELVEKQLTGEEKITLKSLIQKRLIFAFYGGKYSKGVYNIPDSVYPMLGKGTQEIAGQIGKGVQEQKPAYVLQKQPSQPQTGPRPPLNSFAHFEQFGYSIVQMEGDIKEMHVRLKQRIAAGEVMGVRAFDKKLYLATKAFFARTEEKMHPFLDSKGKSLEQIAKASGVDSDACLVILVLLSDSGDVIEKKKGYYSTA